MKLTKIALGLLAVVAAAGTAGWFSLDKETRGLLATTPTNRDLLFWTAAAARRRLPRAGSHPASGQMRDVIATGNAPSPLAGRPAAEAVRMDVDAFMAGAAQRGRGGRCTTASCAWSAMAWALTPPAAGPAFSVAKSMTSTLVGAAIRDGHIKSMDDKVSDYIPQMKGSAYDDVSIRQLLTMTSGVRWNEDISGTTRRNDRPSRRPCLCRPVCTRASS
jgi:CubicO group peptidase (beta-lactamase class C family)